MKKSMKIAIIIFILIIALIIPIHSNANNDIIVMLDPGHGGTDSGATRAGYMEKDIAWKIATKVKEILDNTDGITGCLSRTENQKLDLKQIGNIAASANSDFLVSFHINCTDAYSQTSASGAEVYITGDTTQKRYNEYSRKFGYDILSELRGVGVRANISTPILKYSTDGELYSDGALSDWLAVIRYPMKQEIPGILIEHFYLNNPNDRYNYLNDNMINKMAEADARAIIKNKELFRKNYIGTINTELVNINSILSVSGQNYVGGYVYIAEWVNNECKTPSVNPKIILKSTDGKISEEMYVNYEGGIKYYFDRNIENIDLDKEYYIEAQLIGTNNIASTERKTQIIKLPNQILKQDYNGRILKTSNNKIVFSEGEYVGDIKTTVQELKLVQNGKGENYIGGRISVEEVVNDVARKSRGMPEMYLKSTDGKFETRMYMNYEEGTTYYFDKMIQYLDTSKEYYIETVLTGEDNISKNQKQKMAMGNNKIGEFDGINVIAKDDNMILNYDGKINTELPNMKIIQNEKGENYISGNIYIAEWVNGECRTPTTTPQIKLKSTDNSFEESVYINYEKGIQYYFDKNIEFLDTDKEYYLEVQLTNPNNIASEIEKIQIAQITKKGLVGTCTNNNKVLISGNNILISVEKYYGTINTELPKIQIIQNGKGENYISGRIYIAEWVNGECRTPTSIPIIELKSTDGSFEEITYINYEGGIQYYFDKNIEFLDASKEYYLQVKLTNIKNIASEIEKTQIAKITQQGQIGICTNKNKIIVNNNNIKIDNNSYYGTINTELPKIQIIQNGKGENYISGRIYIAEWVNGKCRTPTTIPQIKLKSTDGSFEEITYINYEGGIQYYFDKNIEFLDTSKEYYLEVKLTNIKNTASEIEKIQIAKITQQGQIGICTNGNNVVVDNNILTIINNNLKLQNNKIITLEKEEILEDVYIIDETEKTIENSEIEENIEDTEMEDAVEKNELQINNSEIQDKEESLIENTES